jgi:hypothetical protein
MYRIHPAYLAWVLDNLAEGRVVNQITVDSQTATFARLALDRMLEVGAKPPAGVVTSVSHTPAAIVDESNAEAWRPALGVDGAESSRLAAVPSRARSTTRTHYAMTVDR